MLNRLWLNDKISHLRPEVAKYVVWYDSITSDGAIHYLLNTCQLGDLVNLYGLFEEKKEN